MLNFIQDLSISCQIPKNKINKILRCSAHATSMVSLTMYNIQNLIKNYMTWFLYIKLIIFMSQTSDQNNAIFNCQFSVYLMCE